MLHGRAFLAAARLAQADSLVDIGQKGAEIELKSEHVPPPMHVLWITLGSDYIAYNQNVVKPGVGKRLRPKGDLHLRCRLHIRRGCEQS